MHCWVQIIQELFLTKLASFRSKRFYKGLPITLLSFDNFQDNSEQLKEALLEVAEIWVESEYLRKDFADYINSLCYPISVIDKIVPAPTNEIQEVLKNDGVNMDIVTTSMRTKTAAFVNAEYYQYSSI